MTCGVAKHEGIYLGSKVLTNIYFNCSQVDIQLAVFYRRKEFLWIGKDDNTPPFNPQWFGDKVRALKMIQPVYLKDQFINYMIIPLNLQAFLYDYKYSSFIECDKDLAALNVARIPNYIQNATKNEKILNGIRYFTQTMESLYKPYFIICGTLLGKLIHEIKNMTTI